MSYLLDANVFIQAKNAYYGFDICPGFWDWIDNAHQAGRVASIDRIGDELKAGNDNLATWARARPGLFLPADTQVITSLRETSAWAAGSDQYDQAAVREYTRVADSQLVAHAHAHGLTVVTHELPSTGKKIKIPNACNALGVPYTSITSVLRSEGVALVLST